MVWGGFFFSELSWKKQTFAEGKESFVDTKQGWNWKTWEREGILQVLIIQNMS